MTKPSGGRQRILALHDRALTFSNRVNQTYPIGYMNHPSRVVWDQLVRAADSTSNNLIEAHELAALFATIVKKAAKQ